jgi:hypothetical protein
VNDLARALEALRAVLIADRIMWAHNDPVAYLWLRRAERRGAIVPWSWS